MMTCFYAVSSLLQILLLIFSQLALVTLTAAIVLMFRRRSSPKKLVSFSIVHLFNVPLYVLMQLNSRITGAEKGPHLHIPYALLLAVTLLSLAYGIWGLLSETRNRKTINNASIKESFDSLPTGVCFFNHMGLPVLCNPAMYRFSFAVCGKDVQFVTDLEQCLQKDFTPATDAKKDGRVFVLPDGTAWHLEKRAFTHKSGSRYTQYTATDVTNLHEIRVELQQENEQLRRVQANLKQLSANVVAITREEEVLNTKMRVHDEMGRCLVEAKKYLKDGSTESIPDSVAISWQRAVAMIKYANDMPEEDMLLQIRKTCQHMKITFLQTGQLPTEEDVAYILTCAVRECVTNAVRYAEATELYADFKETEEAASVSVTNNGKTPESKIVEGGGLSTLRRRVERTGGTMTVQSFPCFKLTVSIPKRKEGVV